MNQFKKAKQLRSETGQATESITDLKTAGVTQKAEKTEPSITEEKTEKKEVQQNNTNILSNSNAETKDNTIPTNTESITAHSDENIDTNIKTVIQTTTKTNEPVLSTQVPNNTVTTASETFEQSVTEPAETIVYNQPVTQTEAAVIEQSKTSYDYMTERIGPIIVGGSNSYRLPTTIPQTVDTPVSIANQPMISHYTTPTEYNDVTPQTIQQQPYIEPQPTQETAAIKHNKSSKKSVPNIFAPKSEAKSMRKSLVLKPTSVKIAENYCEKNGGSFNELIQTLLDNFIDEYGL